MHSGIRQLLDMQNYDPHPTLHPSDGIAVEMIGSNLCTSPPRKCCSELGMLNGFGSIAFDGDADFATARSSQIFHVSEVSLE